MAKFKVDVAIMVKKTIEVECEKEDIKKVIGKMISEEPFYHAGSADDYFGHSITKITNF